MSLFVLDCCTDANMLGRKLEYNQSQERRCPGGQKQTGESMMQYILNFKDDAKVDYAVIHGSQELDEDTEF